MMMNKKQVVSIIGAGAWGTTWAKLLAEKKFKVKFWVREPELLNILRKNNINEFFLPKIKLPGEIEYFGDFQESISDADILLNAVPTQFIRTIWEKATIDGSKIIVNLSKGIEQKTLKLPINILESCINTKNTDISYVNLSGPSFANELAHKLPTILVASSPEKKYTKLIQELFSSQYLRIYGSADIIGTQLGGALKNVIAIACGISDGLGLGHNTRAALMTRGLTEIGRLAKKIGGELETLFGIAGFGDLVLTCTSKLSRNYTFGYKVGRGESPKTIQTTTKTVAEGVDTTPAALSLAADNEVTLPITQEIYNIIFEEKEIKSAVAHLMERPLKFEWERIIKFLS